MTDVKTNEPSGSRAGFAFLLVFLILAAGIVTTGTFYYRNYEKHYRVEVERQLSAIADLKVSGLVQYRKERLRDGIILFKNTSFSALVRRFFEKPEDGDVQRQLQAWIGNYEMHYQYDQVCLLDAQGVIRLSSPAGLPAVSSSVAKDISEVLRSGQVTFQDFYRNDQNQQVYLGVLVPILGEQDAGRPLGVLFLRIDPETYLYPFIKRWPTPSPTAETLLVRREGNDVLFLNELRFQTNAALKLRSPLDRSAMPAVQAVLGREGIMEGLDYRGVPVVAALRTIPDSPWALVARMDVLEVYAPTRERLWQVVAMIGALLLGAGACVGLVWRQQSIRFYRERAAAAETIRETKDYLENLINYANAPIIVWDPLFRITRFNHGFESLTGRKAEEVIGSSLAILFPPAQVASSMALIKKTLGGERWETVEIAILPLDGSVRTVLWNSATIFAADGKTPVAAIAQGQDITERKRAEEALRESEQRHRTILRTAMDGFWRVDLQGRLLEVNEAYCRMSGYSEHELLAMRIPDLEAAETPTDTAAHQQRIVALGEDRFDSRHRHKDGSSFTVEISVQYKPAEGGHQVAFLRDITERKRAEDELRWHNRELSVLYTLRRAIAASLNLDQVLNRAVETTLEILELDGGGIFLLEPDGETMRLRMSRGVSDEFVNKVKRIKLGEGISGRAAAEKKAVVLHVSEYPTERIAPFIIQEGIQTLASTPLLSGGKLIGALNLTSRRPRVFPPNEIELLVAIGQLLGPAVQNAQLFKRVQQELTEGKRSEAALRESERRFRELSESLPQLVWTCRGDGSCDYLSPQWVEYTGIPEAEQLGFAWLEQLHSDDRDRTVAAWNAVVDANKPFDVEFRIRRKDGMYRWFKTRAVAYRDGEGRIVKWFGTNTDIDDQRQAEEALTIQTRIAAIFLTVSDDEMLNEVLKVILDVMHSPFGIFGFIDEDGANVVPTMTRCIWDKCQVPEKTIRFPRETWGCSTWARALLEKRTLYSNEPSANIPEGHVSIQRHISMPILFQGEAIGLFQVANKETDYTEADLRTLETIAGHVAPFLSARLGRSRSQEALRKLNAELEQRVQDRTTDLQAANKELEGFSYSVSHDLRAPLRAIDGYGRILQEDYAERLDGEGRRVLGVISSETRRMGQLVDDLLAFSRLGRRKLESSDINMTALAQAVFDGLAAQAPKRTLQLELKPLHPAHGGRAMMRVVLGNLFSNAIKFSKHRDPAVIEIGSRQEDGQAVYYVKDNGIGFDMKYAHKLFGVFQRLHSTEEFEGTGVGLALVQRIIHRHGGRVWAEGKVNEGATFYFTLPRMKGNP